MATIISRKSLDADDTPGPVVDLDPGALIDEVPAGLDYKQLMADVAFMREQSRSWCIRWDSRRLK